MDMFPIDIKSKVTNGRNVIAFAVDDDEFKAFLEFYDKKKRYKIELTEAFSKVTDNQRGLFYSLLRELTAKMQENFDFVKHYIMTEEGFAITERHGNYIRPKVFYVDKDLVPDVDAYVRECARKQHIYLRNDCDNRTQYGFHMFKGVSMLDSREMNHLLENLKRQCREQGIPVTEQKNE